MMLDEESIESSQDVNVAEERARKEKALQDKKKELRNEFLEQYNDNQVSRVEQERKTRA